MLPKVKEVRGVIVITCRIGRLLYKLFPKMETGNLPHAVGQAKLKVAGLADVKFAIGILQQINPEHVTGKWLPR